MWKALPLNIQILISEDNIFGLRTILNDSEPDFEKSCSSVRSVLQTDLGFGKSFI